MSIIKCKECQEEISSEAKVCPKCGHPNNKSNFLFYFIGFIIVAILVGIMLPNLYAPSGQAKRKITCIHIQSINDALKNFKLQNGVYPTTEEGILALVKNPNPKKYKSAKEIGTILNGIVMNQSTMK